MHDKNARACRNALSISFWHFLLLENSQALMMNHIYSKYNICMWRKQVMYVLFRLHLQFTYMFLKSLGASISPFLCRILFWGVLQSDQSYDIFLVVHWRLMYSLEVTIFLPLGLFTFLHTHHMQTHEKNTKGSSWMFM